MKSKRASPAAKSSGSTDGGTSSRVFGSFLSWMQEKDKAGVRRGHRQ